MSGICRVDVFFVFFDLGERIEQFSSPDNVSSCAMVNNSLVKLITIWMTDTGIFLNT